MLELGSGCGVAGLMAAALGAAHVALTDLPAVLPVLTRNAERSASPRARSSRSGHSRTTRAAATSSGSRRRARRHPRRRCHHVCPVLPARGLRRRARMAATTSTSLTRCAHSPACAPLRRGSSWRRRPGDERPSATAAATPNLTVACHAAVNHFFEEFALLGFVSTRPELPAALAAGRCAVCKLRKAVAAAATPATAPMPTRRSRPACRRWRSEATCGP